jgi:hypothetical protein
VEFVCIDTSRRSLLFGDRFFRHRNHVPFLESAFSARPDAPPMAGPVLASPAVLRRPPARQLEIQPGDAGAPLPPRGRAPGPERPSSTTSSTPARMGSTTS